MRITDDIEIAEWELTEQFVRASGPGGQNVNKVATAVKLRFAASASPNLPAAVKARLKRLAGQKWTSSGEVVIRAETHRSQAQNREDARARLAALIAKAAVRPKRRIPTRPTLGSKRRRLEAKTRRGQIKAGRQAPSVDD